MPPKSVVVLLIDRLGAAWVGPYGNSWLDTPNFNRLATRSVLFESAIASTADLSEVYRGLWTGRHVLEPKPADALSVPAMAAKKGSPILLTDDESVAKHELANDFAEIHFQRPGRIEINAPQVERTDLFGFFDAACELVSASERPNLVWLHARGMSGPWDAPLELREQFADEDDPVPPPFVAPPEKMLEAGFDPDELLGFTQAYAGQVALADVGLGLLMESLDSHSLADETLFIVTSPRGYPLGEHQRVGPCDNALYGELLHVPLLIQFPGGQSRMTRNQQIVQPHRALDILRHDDDAKFMEQIVNPRPEPQSAFAVGDRQRAIRTPAWFLREKQVEGEPVHELFAKPDDRFEANEISSRCGDVVELLAAELDRFAAAAEEGKAPESPPLAEVLYDTWR
ncbi:MAG TPA: sulfatase-like hydrolase/transferase [Pirellulaceae bacterium]|jgi:arylsulfatase A-like enzyme